MSVVRVGFASRSLVSVSVVVLAFVPPASADRERAGAVATVLNPAGQSRTFRVSRPSSAAKLLRYVADANRDGRITGADARRSRVARHLLDAADSYHPGGRNRLTAREIARYARLQAGRDGRFSQRELDRMLNRLRVRRPAPPRPPAPTSPSPDQPLPTSSAPSLPPGSSPPLPPSALPPHPPPSPTPPPSVPPTPTSTPAGSPTPTPTPHFEPFTVEEAGRSLHNIFDTDDNGIVDAADRDAGQPLLCLMGVDSADVTQVLQFVAVYYDTNSSGMIDYAENQRIFDDLLDGTYPDGCGA